MAADALVRTLNQGGYLPVFLARPGMSPPDVYTVNDGGRLERHGPLKTYLTDKTVTYGVQTNPFHDIVLSHTSEKSLQGAASFLTSALKCIGIGAAPKLNLGFAGSNSFIFSFEEITIESVDSAEIETTLGSLDLSVIPAKDTARGRLHVAYEYLCASRLLMYRGDKAKFKGDIKGQVGDFIDVGVSGVVDASDSSVIKFKSTTQSAPFAYKSGSLEKRGGKWQFRVSQIAADFVGIPGAPAAEALPYLPARGVVLSAV
jgi:hypothetical protein